MATFKDIKGFPGYKVGDNGTVWSNKHGRWKELKRARQGRYLVVCLRHNGLQRTMGVHRIVLEAFVGPCPAGLQGCHNNGDAHDNRLENLRWDTPKNNTADQVKHGTMVRGSRQGQAKLIESTVKEIRAKYAAGGVGHRQLAVQYGVGRSTMLAVVNKTSWKHV